MGKRLGVLGVVSALVALVVGAVSPASGSSSNDDNQQTIRVFAVIREQVEIDVGTEGLSLGDQAVFPGPLVTGRFEGRPTRDRLYVHVRAGAEGEGAVPSDRHTA